MDEHEQAPDAERATFGRLLRRYRLAAALSQEELAERARLSTHAISALERGRRQAPYRGTVDLLAVALGLNIPEAAALAAAVPHRRGPRGPLPQSLPAAVAPQRPYRAVEQPLDLPPLVGRAREVLLLERHLRGEGPPLLVLAGEPGIGKSRLLRETTTLAAQHGCAVLAGGCRQRGGQEPYAPVVDALLRHLRHLPPAQAQAQLQGCAWLVKLAPELAEEPIPPLPAWTVSPAQERRLSFAAATRFLATAASPAGAVLLLDDLQWAGPDALDLVRTLVGEAPESGLRVVAAYRDTEAPAGPLRQLLADLAQTGAAAQRTLGPLAPAEAGQLLTALLEEDASGLGAGAREQVVRRTGGVPFFLVSCAQGRQHEDAVEASAAGVETGGGALPWSVSESVRQRVAALPPAAQTVLGLAAVAGREVPRHLLLDAAAHPEEEVLAALDAATRARLLEEVGAAAYRFPHDLIREVLETDLGAARRAGLHRALTAVLERQPGAPPVEALAYHYAQAGEDARAAQWLERAGDQAAGRGASATALEHYASARKHLAGAGGEGAALSRLDEKLGDLYLLTSAAEQAEAAFARARAPEADPARRAELRRKEGVSWMRQGDYERALRALAAADAEGGGADGVSTLPPGVRAAIELSRGYIYVQQANEEFVPSLPAGVPAAIELGRGDVYVRQDGVMAAEASAVRALALLSAEPPGLPQERALALAARLQHSVAFATEDFVRAGEFAEQGLARSERLGDREEMAWWWKARGFIAYERGQRAYSEECFRRGLQMAEEIGDQDRAVECWLGLGVAAADLRDYDRAEACLQRALAVAQRIGNPWHMAKAWTWLGLLSRERGRLSEAIARCSRSGLTNPATPYWNALAWCLWFSGDLVGAEQALRRSYASREHTRYGVGLTYACLGLGGVLGDRGDLTAARHWLRHARHTARRFGLAILEVEATVERGRTDLRAGRRRGAEACLRHAWALVQVGDASAGTAHAQVLAAELHLADGRLSEAETAAEDARRLAAGGTVHRLKRAIRGVPTAHQGRPLQAQAQRLLGLCAVQQGRGAEGVTHLRAALALQLELGAALEAARTRLLLAEALAEATEAVRVPAEALTLLGEAHAQFATSGAAPDLARAEYLSAAWTGRCP
jgi:tetratricopeptide (TPR) repeat protein/transcriptional regulator with XRE-family HTH domain